MENPANTAQEIATTRPRVPVGARRQKLQVPKLPGYHLHWFYTGVAGRINAALQGGYEFVNPEEVFLENFDVAGDVTQGGGADLGSRVAIISGEHRLYLMKIKEEWWLEDQAALQARNDEIADAIRQQGLAAENERSEDRGRRYVKQYSTSTDDTIAKRRS